MRRAGLVALAAAALLLQISLLPALRPFGVVPDLVLVLVVLVGLEGTASLALALAIVDGLALDLASGTNFGLWTGVLVLAALVTGLLHRAGVELGGGVVALVMVAAGTLIVTAVILLGLANVVGHWPWGSLAVRFGTELVLNLILTMALRPVVHRLAPSSGPNLAVVG